MLCRAADLCHCLEVALDAGDSDLLGLDPLEQSLPLLYHSHLLFQRTLLQLLLNRLARLLLESGRETGEGHFEYYLIEWGKYIFYLLRVFSSIFRVFELLQCAHQKPKHATVPVGNTGTLATHTHTPQISIIIHSYSSATNSYS